MGWVGLECLLRGFLHGARSMIQAAYLAAVLALRALQRRVLRRRSGVSSRPAPDPGEALLDRFAGAARDQTDFRQLAETALDVARGLLGARAAALFARQGQGLSLSGSREAEPVAVDFVHAAWGHHRETLEKGETLYVEDSRSVAWFPALAEAANPVLLVPVGSGMYPAARVQTADPGRTKR